MKKDRYEFLIDQILIFMFLRFTMLNSFPHLSILPDCRHEVDVDSIDGDLVQYQFACHFVVDFSHLQKSLQFSHIFPNC